MPASAYWPLSSSCPALKRATLERSIWCAMRHKVSEDTDAPLSEAGRERAKCLAATLADAQIEQIFISDLQRTQQTAAPLAEKLHLKPVAIPISKPERSGRGSSFEHGA